MWFEVRMWSMQLNGFPHVTIKRSVPIRKLIESAAANAKDLHNIAMSDLKIVDIRIDRGPMHKVL